MGWSTLQSDICNAKLHKGDGRSNMKTGRMLDRDNLSVVIEHAAGVAGLREQIGSAASSIEVRLTGVRPANSSTPFGVTARGLKVLLALDQNRCIIPTSKASSFLPGLTGIPVCCAPVCVKDASLPLRMPATPAYTPVRGDKW